MLINYICLEADTKPCKILFAEKSIIKKGKSKWPLTGAGQITVHPYIGHTAAGVLLSSEGWKKTLDQNDEKIISLFSWEKRRQASIPSSPGVLGVTAHPVPSASSVQRPVSPGSLSYPAS